jgi:hypothetical protein
MDYSVKSPKLSTVAVFDFDGTLTHRDSFFPFLRFLSGQWQFTWGLLMMSPVLLGYALKLIPNWRAKETLLIHFLANKELSWLTQTSERFAHEIIPNLLRSEAIECLKWHQEQGHKTILISASLEIYLLPWAKKMGFQQVIGTQLDLRNNCCTGRISGKNCYGAEKVRRLESHLGDLGEYLIYAYGDSRGDLQLLNVSDYPYYKTFHKFK